MSIEGGISHGKGEEQDSKISEHNVRLINLEQSLDALRGVVVELKASNATLALLNSKVAEMEIAMGLLEQTSSVGSNVDKLGILLNDVEKRYTLKLWYKLTKLFK